MDAKTFSAGQLPTELRFELFTDGYARVKGLKTVGLTIDENNCLRIIDGKGELEAYEFTSHVEIQKFFDLAGEVFRSE